MYLLVLVNLFLFEDNFIQVTPNKMYDELVILRFLITFFNSLTNK